MYNYLSSLTQFYSATSIADRLFYALVSIAIAIIIPLILRVILGQVKTLKLDKRPTLEIFLDFLVKKLILRLNKAGRGAGALRIRGVIILIFITMLMLAFVKTLTLLMLNTGINLYYRDILLLLLCLSPIFPTLTIWDFLKKDSNKENKNLIYLSLAKALYCNLISQDEHGIKRQMIRFLTIGFIHYLCGPLIFYIAFGAYGLVIWLCLIILIKRTSGEGHIGGVIHQLYNIFGWIINGTASLMLKISLFFIPRTHKQKSGAQALSIENGGACIGHIANALNISLGGAYQNWSGKTVQEGWAGKKDASAKIDTYHVQKTLYTIFIAKALFIVCLFTLFRFIQIF